MSNIEGIICTYSNVKEIYLWLEMFVIFFMCLMVLARVLPTHCISCDITLPSPWLPVRNVIDYGEKKILMPIIYEKHHKHHRKFLMWKTPIRGTNSGKLSPNKKGTTMCCPITQQKKKINIWVSVAHLHTYEEKDFIKKYIHCSDLNTEYQQQCHVCVSTISITFPSETTLLSMSTTISCMNCF